MTRSVRSFLVLTTSCIIKFPIIHFYFLYFFISAFSFILPRLSRPNWCVCVSESSKFAVFFILILDFSILLFLSNCNFSLNISFNFIHVNYKRSLHVIAFYNMILGLLIFNYLAEVNYFINICFKISLNILIKIYVSEYLKRVENRVNHRCGIFVCRSYVIT